MGQGDVNKTIGCFVSPYRHEYMVSVINGVRAACEAEGYSLVLISATLQDYLYGVQRSSVIASFEWAAAARLDAYVVIYGVLNQLAVLGGEKLDFERECLRLLPRDRTLIIEEGIPGYHCLTKDNIPGMREIMSHLIDECGYRRIGMISGQEESHSARERESVYFEEMAAHGLPTEDGWFARAENSGTRQDAVDAFVAANTDLEAIVCGTDAIALNTYRALDKVGLKPGTDIAVTGHDDQPSASAAIPPITTVSLDPFDFGYAAGREAARLLRGEPQVMTKMRGHMIARGSCGENLASGREAYRQLVCLDPFPADDVTWIILNECVKTLVAHEKPVYHDVVYRLVEAAHQVWKCGLGEVRLESVSNVRELGVFARGEKFGEFRLERFQNAFNEYLYALVETAPPEHRDAVTHVLVHTNQTLTRHLDLEGLDRANSQAAYNLALSKIVQGALNAGDTYAALGAMIDGIAQAGAQNAFVLLFDEPKSFASGVQQPVPGDLRVAAGVIDGKATVFGADDPRIAPEKMWELTGRIEGSHVFSSIGLYEDRELLGFFISETDSTEFSAAYFMSLQVTYALRHVQIVQDELEMISMLDQSNVQLRLDSQTDVLSGLLNRRGFIERARGRLTSAPTPFGAVFYLDLDRFKGINDRFGHDVGDDAIRDLGNILRGSLRTDDLVARAGGDEFILFVNVGAEDEVAAIRERIENNIAKFNAANKKPYHLHASIGYHVFRLTGSVDLEDAIKCADQMQYQVKKAHHAVYGDKR